jgi:hypothetical protein
VLDKLGERGPAGDGSGEGERGTDEAFGMQDGVEAQVAEMAGCLRLLAWNVPRAHGNGAKRMYSRGVEEFGDVEEGKDV